MHLFHGAADGCVSDTASTDGGESSLAEEFTNVNLNDVSTQGGDRTYVCSFCKESDTEGPHWVKFKHEGACVWACQVCAAQHYLDCYMQKVAKAQEALAEAKRARAVRVSAIHSGNDTTAATSSSATAEAMEQDGPVEASAPSTAAMEQS